MKKLDSYLTEKLVISKDTIKKPNYKYHPKNRSELIDLLLQLQEERGNNANLNDIDVSKVIDMNALFYEGFKEQCENIDISEWDVSNVINMNSMFYRCYNFDCDLSSWDVSKVTDMAHMFEYCREFDTSTTKNWTVNAHGKKVKDMFHGVIKGDIPDWWWKVEK